MGKIRLFARFAGIFPQFRHRPGTFIQCLYIDTAGSGISQFILQNLQLKHALLAGAALPVNLCRDKHKDMKSILVFLKWTGIVLVLLLLSFSITVALRQDLRFDAPYPDIHASSDPQVIERGRHIVYSQAHCADCHSTQNVDSLMLAGVDPTLSGGKLFDVGIAKFYTANLTSDTTYGLGRRTDAEIARVLRYGVHANGRAVPEFMGFHDMSDADLTSVISYLRTLKPVANEVPPAAYSIIGYAIKAFLIKPNGPMRPLEKYVQPDSSARYGEYIVHSTTNCAGCHTRRDLAGKMSGPLMAGGNEIGGLITPNLTTDSSSRIFGWTEQMFIERFRKGKIVPQSEMPWNSFKHMTDLELKAIYRYLQTLPAAKMPMPEN
jgi:mono/diheme cytochrome c family protein